MGIYREIIYTEYYIKKNIYISNEIVQQPRASLGAGADPVRGGGGLKPLPKENVYLFYYFKNYQNFRKSSPALTKLMLLKTESSKNKGWEG